MSEGPGRSAEPDGVSSILDHLRALPALRGLSDARLAVLQDSLTWKRLRSGEVLCRTGDPGDRAWVLVSGRLKVYAPTPEGEVFRHTLGPGTFLGTVALLRGGRRTATLIAARDVALIEVSEQAFLSLLQHEPEAARRVLGAVTGQLIRQTGPRSGGEVRVVTLVPLHDPGDVLDIAGTLVSALQPIARAAVVTAVDVEQALGPEAREANPPSALDDRLTDWLSHQEQRYEVVFLVSDPTDSPWTRRCVRHGDRVVLVADANASRGLRAVEEALAEAHVEDAVDLLLIHPPFATRGRDTAEWLHQRPEAGVLHLRRARPQDAGRVARSLLRRGVGLALGGGGSRALGHVGVAGAFADHGIPIDVVSGTSAGAAVAALIGMMYDYEQIIDAVGALLSSTRGHARDVGPPVVSLMSGRHARRLLDDMFGGAMLEDLFIPARTVSVDLRRAEPYTFSRGPIWQAVRASAALPLVWPPVLLEERVLVDGGLQDNLPARSLLSHARHGAIVASQVFAYRGGRMPMRYEQATLSGWRALRHLVRQDTRLPGFVEVTLRAMMQGSKLSDEETIRRYVDLLLQPDVGRIGMFDVRSREDTVKVSRGAREDVSLALQGWDWQALLRPSGEGR